MACFAHAPPRALAMRDPPGSPPVRPDPAGEVGVTKDRGSGGGGRRRARRRTSIVVLSSVTTQLRRSLSIGGTATSWCVRLVSVGGFSQGSSYPVPPLKRCIIGRDCVTDDPTVTKLPLGIREDVDIVSRQQLEIVVTATDEVQVRVFDTRAKTGIIFASGARDFLSGEACLSAGDVLILDPGKGTSGREPPEHFSYAYKVVVEPAEAMAAPALLQGDRASVAPVAPVVPQGNGPASPAPPPIVPMEPDVATPAPDAVPAPMATEPPAPDRQEAPPPIPPESDASEDALADAAETATGPVYTEEVYAAVQLEGTTRAERVQSLWRVLKRNSRRGRRRG